MTEETKAQHNEIILEDIDELRGLVSGCLGDARVVSANIARGAGGREVSLAITKLQEAQSWLRLAQEVLTRSSAENTEATYD